MTQEDIASLQVQDQAEFVPADLITEKKTGAFKGHNRINWLRYIALFVVVLTGGIALFRGSPALFTRPTTVLLVV